MDSKATFKRPLTRLLLPANMELSQSAIQISHAGITHHELNRSMIFSEIRIIKVGLDNETAEERGVDKRTQHYRSNNNIWIEDALAGTGNRSGVDSIHVGIVAWTTPLTTIKWHTGPVGRSYSTPQMIRGVLPLQQGRVRHVIGIV
jgi:hypothetical protein